MNVGYLSTQRPGLVPCTPAGILEILKRSNIPIAGAEAWWSDAAISSASP